MGKILQADGTPFPRRRARRTYNQDNLHASFDSAQSHNDNKNHWANADALSPNSALSEDIRKTIRNRARYEIANNSFLKGMLQTKVNYIVGRGPRLQMTSGSLNERKEIETAWKEWSRKVGLAHKLRTMIGAKIGTDGEGFAVFTNDRKQTPVQLGLRLFEADHVTDPWFNQDIINRSTRTERRLDGVRLDSNGDPAAYFVLNHHPGSDYYSANPTDGRWRSADQIIHLYREDRPSQRRGLPYITPALPLFSILRRYTLAALHTAEWTSETNAIMKSTATMTAEEADEVEDFLEIPWARNMLLTLPVGWDLEQLKAADTTTTFGEFYRQVLNEAARCIDTPYNIAAANSSDSNYSSGRMDRLLFFKANQIEIDELEINAVERIFENWLKEYFSVKSGIAPDDIDISSYSHLWGWDGVEDDDPEKIAKSDETYWNLGLLTDQRYCLRHNIDPEEHYAELEEQNRRRKAHGLPLPGVAMQQINTGEGAEESSEPSLPDPVVANWQGRTGISTECTLNPAVLLATTFSMEHPCDRCNMDRSVCNGFPRRNSTLHRITENGSMNESESEEETPTA